MLQGPLLLWVVLPLPVEVREHTNGKLIFRQDGGKSLDRCVDGAHYGGSLTLLKRSGPGSGSQQGRSGSEKLHFEMVKGGKLGTLESRIWEACAGEGSMMMGRRLWFRGEYSLPYDSKEQTTWAFYSRFLLFTNW